MAYHTDLRLVFRAFGGRQREFNWLITDLKLNPYPPGLPYLPDVPRARERRWLSGAELTDIVEAHDVQFDWGVLSGFRPGVALDLGRARAVPLRRREQGALGAGRADPAPAGGGGDRVL